MKMLKVTCFGRNGKIGVGVSTTHRPIGLTCPSTCALLGNGCYGQRGHTNIHQRRSADDDHHFGMLEDGFGLVRHGVTGDAYQNDALDADYVQAMIDFHAANEDWTGWLYTHRIQDWDKGGYTVDTMPAGLHVIASVDTEVDRQYAVDNGWRYARVVDADNPALLDNEMLCPVDKAKRDGTKPTTCKKCKACFQGGRNIVFQLQKPTAPKPRKKKTPATAKVAKVAA